MIEYKYKPCQWVKYDFIGIDPKRYKLLLIEGIKGDYYFYRRSIQLPRLLYTKWDFDNISYIHVNGGLYRDEECIKMERQYKLQRILK